MRKASSQPDQPNPARPKPTKRELIDRLLMDPISYANFIDPVVASDLQLYSRAQYMDCRSRNPLSPITHEPLRGEPFPMTYRKLSTLIEDARLTNLCSLATCPITHCLMSDPRRVHMVFTDFVGNERDFLIVCDAIALVDLPEDVRIVKAIEWTDLKMLIEHPSMNAALTEQAARVDHTPVIANLGLRWEMAMLESSGQDFLPAPPPPPPQAVTNIYRGAVAVARQQYAPPGPPELFPPGPPELPPPAGGG